MQCASRHWVRVSVSRQNGWNIQHVNKYYFKTSEKILQNNVSQDQYHFSFIFISQHKHSYIELFGPGQEGSFLGMLQRQGAAKTSSLDVGGEDKAIGSSPSEDGPGACGVMYSMLSLIRCCSQGNRRGFRLSSWGQPACCPLWYSGGHSAVLWCDRALANALCRETGLWNHHTF